MGQVVDRYLERMAACGAADRRNGCYHRCLLTELGHIGPAVPRTRGFSAAKVVRAYGGSRADLDDLPTCFRYPMLSEIPTGAHTR